MSDSSLDNLPKGWKSVPNDLGSDQTAFKGVQWGKAMMWIFLLSDTFIFSCFLMNKCSKKYLVPRISRTEIRVLGSNFEVAKSTRG